jgi:Zn-dependent protease with chaperone function
MTIFVTKLFLSKTFRGNYNSHLFMQPPFNTASYRYPNERLILFITILLVLGVIVFTSAATLCGSALFVALMLIISTWASASKHQQLIGHAQPVNDQTIPALAVVTRDAMTRLQPGPVQTFVVPAKALNAYTFGLSSPKVVVLYSGLLQVMDADEVKFIIGHELGHVRLGHTWLNSVVGGMAGIPSPFGAAVILYFAFRWWNRACEFSADRAGLLACGDLNKAVSALVKIETGGSYTRADHDKALQPLSSEDALVEDFGDLFSTHPGIKRRVDQLRQYASTAEYQRLQQLVNANVS